MDEKYVLKTAINVMKVNNRMSDEVDKIFGLGGLYDKLSSESYDELKKIIIHVLNLEGEYSDEYNSIMYSNSNNPDGSSWSEDFLDNLLCNTIDVENLDEILWKAIVEDDEEAKSILWEYTKF